MQVAPEALKNSNAELSLAGLVSQVEILRD